MRCTVLVVSGVPCSVRSVKGVLEERKLVSGLKCMVFGRNGWCHQGCLREGMNGVREGRMMCRGVKGRERRKGGARRCEGGSKGSQWSKKLRSVKHCETPRSLK